MCGKNRYILCSSTKTLESPPRVREKLLSKKFALTYIRITPACAGKTLLKRWSIVSERDHPRVCGKNRLNF